jgi:FAD-linked oxidoreductase
MLSRRSVLVAAGTVATVTAASAAGDVVLERSRDVEPVDPPPIDAQGRLLWRNWSGIETAYPAARAAPASEDELAALLKTAQPPVRAVGAGHSFTALVPTPGTLVSLDNLAGIVSHDADKLQAVVRTGTRLGALGEALAGIGQEMYAQPDINKQSLGGALGTATHGTGVDQPALHGGVIAFRMVTARGDVVTVSPGENADMFSAARVGLGAFGIITEVTLQNRALSRIRKQLAVRPTQDALDDWPALKRSHRTAEIYIVPFTGMSAVITSNPTSDPVQPRGPDTENQDVLDLKYLRDVLGPVPWLRRLVAQWTLGGSPPIVAVDEGWKLLSNERPLRFNEMEYHLPAEAQIAAAREILAAVEKNRPDVFFPFELRCIAADESWLSPFYQRASGSVAVHAYYQNDYSFLFELVEPILRRHGGRPHWGKLNSLRGADFAALYPRFKDAMQVRQSLDPDGKFLNAYVRRTLTHV